MDSTEIESVIAARDNSRVEFKAVLPPSANIARSISAFGNSGGGYIILGVAETAGGPVVNGLSSDFRVREIVHQAIDKVVPHPTDVTYEYVTVRGKQLFVIKIGKHTNPLLVDGVAYKRSGGSVQPITVVKVDFRPQGYARIKVLDEKVKALGSSSTASKRQIVRHYQSTFKMLDDLGGLLYPEDPSIPTEIPEGKILSRVLFAFVVDNFEGYLSDLLYEIYLARPETLRSPATVTVEEVLKCGDMQEFIGYIAREKIQKLQKGSVAGFIKENEQISSLKVMDKTAVKEIEKILQIRHLFTHRNGIADEKFLRFYPGSDLKPGDEFRLSVDAVCDRMEYLIDIIDKIDKSSIEVYHLDAL